MLEDDSGRIILSGEVPASERHSIVTGIVVAVKGREKALGDFEVTDYIFKLVTRRWMNASHLQ